MSGTRLWRRSGVGSGRLLRLLLVACVAAVLSVSVAASTANAWSYGYIYISLPTWEGNCLYGQLGHVSIISGAVDWMSSVSMDRGDDIVYMRVRLNDWNTVSFTAFCNKWPGYWQPGFSQRIYPTRNNQTYWVGPGGTYHN